MQPELHVDVNFYNKAFPNFGKPKIIGIIDMKNLKFARNIQEKSVKFDLNLHLDKVIRKPKGQDVKLTVLLKFLLENELRLDFPLGSRLEKAKFFCYRGLLTCIACTPYENREPWKIMVILHKGNIYLCARDTKEKLNRIRNMTEKEIKFSSWGYKFEQFILSDTPNTEANPDLPVDENEGFSLIFTTHLNKHIIVYGAEMDGIRCDKTTVPEPPAAATCNISQAIEYLSSKEFIELKTSRHIEYTKQETSFRRFKTKKWWCQSFLVGIDTILCGFRNDHGIVEELKVYNINDLPKISKRFWQPNVCFNFLDTFLTYVKRCLESEIKRKHGERAMNNLQNLPLISFIVEWNPDMPVQVTQENCHQDDPILPEWFTDAFGVRK